ncbi:MAG TPA: zf-HC2 domain-containing protein [Solirubrobacteraceae bacterium]|nr:zf-HC2 domain-containing protein [Solirubrobacteraceae bacterium]
MPAAVTPSGVRDGDPAALAGLCAARGPSVLAYCRHVAGDDGAADAAAESFAAFRAAVVATPDLTELNPEALLINVTRRSAASRAPRALIDICAVVPLLLAARADKTISPADREVLEEHLADCWTCRAPVARFDAAERAYRDPPTPLMDPAIIAAMIAAMAAAAPVGDDEPHAPAPNGDDPVPATAQAVAVEHTTADAAPDESTPDAAAPVETATADEVDQPTTEFRAPVTIEPERAAADDLPSRRSATPVSVLAAGGAGSRSRGGGGSGSRGKLPLSIVLPVVVVLIAVLVALFVAGVFGGDDPASSPRVGVPSDVPAQSEPADVVVVPGAKEASPDAVEVAKARERERARRSREAATNREAATAPQAATPSTDNTSPPPAAPPPTQPPPPPPAATRDDGARTVEPGRGATGAEQIPPAKDTSTVPDLAPAPEPATAP